MWVWIDRLASMVLDASLSATVLLCLVALAMLGCRQPARRIRLARAAIVCSLLIFPLIALAPFPRFDLIAALRSADLLPRIRDESPAFPPPHPADLQIDPIAPPPALTAWSGTWTWVSRWPLRSLTLFYLAGVGLGLAWFLLGCWGVVWITGRSVEPSPESLALYESLPLERLRRRPRLRISRRVGRPVLVGSIRQTILIPPELEAPEAAPRLRLSLLHELAHSEGADPWFSLAGSLAQAFWFFLPPLWWIRAQLRLDQEFLADRRAAGRFGPLRNYASSLLDLADPKAGPSPNIPSLSPAPTEGTGSALFQRVLMLVHCPFPVEPRPPTWWSWSLPALVVMATIATCSLCIRGNEVPNPAPPVSPRPGPAQPRVFAVGRLAVPARPPDPQGRAPVFDLPIRLPANFDLHLDVWGDADTIAHSRVVGHRLVDLAPPSSNAPDIPDWHQVRVRCDGGRISVWLDQNLIALELPNELTTSWLSVEPPPDQTGRYRNLSLTW